MTASSATELMTNSPLALQWRRWIALAVALGLVVRLLFVVFYWHDKPLTNDEQEYLLLAGSLARGEGLTYPPSAAVAGYGRAPGYPAFLAPLVGGGPLPASVPLAVKLAQCFLGALGVWLVSRLACALSGPRAGVIAAGIAAVYQPLVWLSGFALSEALYSPLILAAALLVRPLTDDVDPPPRRRPLVAGVALGIAALVRPSALVYLAAVVLWLGLRRRAVVMAAVVFAGAFLVIAPWTARNVIVHGRLVLIASEGGITFWTGNHPLSSGDGDMAANLPVKLANRTLRARFPGLTQEELEPIYYREAIHAIVADPIGWFGLLARKAFYLWVPIGRSYRLHSGRHYALTIVSYALVLPFAIAGVWMLVRRESQPWFLWLLGLSAAALSILFLSTERYRIPVIDPVLIVCAAAWWARARAASLRSVAPAVQP